jgi:PAS domain S-box-containing protein
MKEIHEIIKLRELTEKLNGRGEKLLFAVREMQLVFDSLVDLVIIVDTDHNIKYANKAALKAFGESLEELTGKKQRVCKDLLCDHGDEDCLKKICLIKHNNAQESVLEDERHFKGKLNGWYKRTRTLIINGNDDVIGAVCMFRDVSDRKKVEQKLLKSQQRFYFFMDNVPLGVFIKDYKSKTVYVNKYMLEAFGVEKEDYLGKTPFDIFPRNIAEKMVKADKMAMSKGKCETIDVVPHKDGTNHVYKTCKFVLESKDGKPKLLGGVTIDVTDKINISLDPEGSDLFEIPEKN